MNKKFTIWIAATIITIFIILSFVSFVSNEEARKPVLKDKTQDYNYLYNLYINGNPSLSERQYLGFENTSITITTYVDLTDETTKNFIRNIFPKIKEEYINTGKVRFYAKHHLTADDISEKSETYTYAQTLACVNKLQPQSYFELFFSIVNNEKFVANISNEVLRKCINEAPMKELLEDASEVETLGISWIKPSIYIGIQGSGNTPISGTDNYERIKRVIKNKEIQLGV